MTRRSPSCLLLCLLACDPGDDADTTTGTSATATATDDDPTGPGEPATANIIFVTSTAHDGALAGLAGADEICNARAAAAGLPGTYVAWLSTADVDAIDRLGQARGWMRPDGRPFADTAEDLLGRAWFPPILDEFGAVVPEGTMTLTGTDYEGKRFAVYSTCEDWTSNAGLGGDDGVGLGDPFGVFATWSNGGAGICDRPRPLTCLAIDLAVALEHPPVAGRLAFISEKLVVSDGLAALDARCQSDAAANQLPGTYRALVATADATAASRFDLSGPTWVRRDGVPIFAQAADLPDGRLLAPVVQQADATSASALVRLGAATPGSPSDGSCADWTAATGETRGGNSRYIGATAFSTLTLACDEEAAVYCLQE